MLTVSDDYKYHINSDSQIVKPSVIATWADARYLENMRVISTEDPYYKRGLSLNPALFFKMNEASRWSFLDNNANIQDYSDNQIHAKSFNGVNFNQSTGFINNESESRYLQTTTYLSCDGTSGSFSWIDNAAADVTGTIDIRVKLTTSITGSTLRTLVGKWNSTSQSYLFQIDTDNTLKFSWVKSGETTVRSVSSSNISDNISSGLSNSRPFWLRVVMNTTSNIIQFYTNTDGNWKQLGSDISNVNATNIKNTARNSYLTIGADGNTGANNRITAKFYDVQLYNVTTLALRARFENTALSGTGTWRVGATSGNDLVVTAASWTVAGTASIGGDSYIAAETSNTLNTVLNTQNNLVIETWFRIDTPGTSATAGSDPFNGTGIGTILDYSTGSSPTSRKFNIRIQGNQIRASVFSGSNEYILYGTSNIYPSNSNIFHIILSIQKYNNNKVITLFLNGFISDQIILNNFTLNDVYGPLTIGASNAGSIGNYLTGLKVGGVFIYNDSSVLFRPESFATARYNSASATFNYSYSDYFEAEEIANNRSTESFSWAVLDAITNTNIKVKSNGNYYLAEEDPNNTKHQYGWWSRGSSLETKIFLEFDTRKINFIDFASSCVFNKISSANFSYILKNNYQNNKQLMYKNLTLSISPEKETYSTSYPIYNDPYYDGVSKSNSQLLSSITSVVGAATDGIDIRAHIDLDDWSIDPTGSSTDIQVIASQWDEVNNKRSWFFGIDSQGKLTFAWSANGSSTVATVKSTIPFDMGDGSKHWVRVEHRKNNGSAQNVTTFYVSDDGTTWSKLGNAVTTATAATYYTTSPDFVRIGNLQKSGGTVSYGFTGKIYRIIAYNYGSTDQTFPTPGTAIFNYIPSLITVNTSDSGAGTTSVVDTNNNSWTMTNASILRNSYLECDGITLDLTSSVYPNERFRILEFSPVYKTDISDDIIDMSLSKVRENYDSSVPLGITGANTFDFNLDNTSQKYNKYNVNSIYYPYVEPEITIQSGLKYPKFAFSRPGVANNYAYTVSSTNFDVSNSLTLIVELSTDTWKYNNTILSKWNDTGNKRSWKFGFKNGTSNPKLFADFSSDGTNITFAATSNEYAFIASKKYFLRCILSQPATVARATFDISTDGITWTSLGYVEHTTSLNLADNTEKLIVGAYNDGANGASNNIRFYSASVKVGTTIVANPSFCQNVNYDTTVLADDYGNPWKIISSGTTLKAQIAGPKYLSPFSHGGLAYFKDNNSMGVSANGIDLIVKMSLNNWFAGDQVIAAKSDVNAPIDTDSEWIWYLSSGSFMTFSVNKSSGSTGGSFSVSSDVPVGYSFTPGSTHWLRVSYTKSTADVKFYISDDGINWGTAIDTVPLPNPPGAPATLINTNDLLTLGGVIGKTSSSFVNGKIYYFQYSDPVGGTVFSELDFNSWDENSQTGYDLQGQLWTALNSVEEEYEFIPFGEFYADSINNDGSSMSANIKCRDRSRFLQDQTLPDGFVYSDKTASQAIGNLAKYANIPLPKIKIQKSFTDTIKEFSPLFYWRFNELKQTKRHIATNGLDELQNKHYTSYYPNSITLEGAGSTTDAYSHFYNFSLENSTANGTVENPTTTNTTTFTFECWLNVPVSTFSGNIFTINLGSTSATTDTFKLELAATTYGVQATVNGTLRAPSSTLSINDGLWHHIAVTIDASGNLIYYKDGVKFGNTVVIGSWTGLPKSNGLLQLGNVNANFLISDIRIWNTSRTVSEIVTNMSVELLGHETGLVSYWRCSDPDILNLNGGTVEFLKNKTNPTYWLARSGSTGENLSISLSNSKLFFNNDLCYVCNLTEQTNNLTYGKDSSKIINDSSSKSITFNNTNLVGFINNNSSKLKKSDGTNQLQELTFSVFIKPTVIPSLSYGNAHIYSCYSSNKGIKISINPSGGITVNYDTSSLATANNIISANNVYHIAVSIREQAPNDTNGIISIYVNGILQISQSMGTLPTTGWFPTNISIGSNAGASFYTGSMSEFAIFPYGMSAEDILYIYQMANAIEQDTYPSLYGGAEDIWSLMLSVATADLGMFFFDENNDFIYQGGNRFFDPIYTQNYNSQYALSDSVDIISANQEISLVANSISCKVYKKLMDSNGESTRPWEAENGESLARTTINSAISAASKTITFDVIQETSDVYIPYFLQTGYVKIDNEIIKFKQSERGMLTVEERGALGTTAAAHDYGAGLGEVRVYDMEFNDAPISYLKGIYLDAVYNGDATIESWSAGSYRGHLIISTTGSETPEYTILNGTDPLTSISYQFYVSGIPGNTSGNDSSESATQENKASIRKYGIKELIIDNPFIQNKSRAENIVAFLIKNYSSNVGILNINTIGLPHLQLSDKITISSYNQMNISNKNYWIISMNINYNGGIDQNMTLKEVSS